MTGKLLIPIPRCRRTERSRPFTGRLEPIVLPEQRRPSRLAKSWCTKSSKAKNGTPRGKANPRFGSGRLDRQLAAGGDGAGYSGGRLGRQVEDQPGAVQFSRAARSPG